MQLKEIILPAMGEGITDATIIRWLVNEGEQVKSDQPLVEIATDKVDSEVHSPSEGILKKIMAASGDIAKVGETIAVIAIGVGEIDEDSLLLITGKKAQDNILDPNKSSATFKKKRRLVKNTISVTGIDYNNLPFISPFARLMISKLNIDVADLFSKISISKNDTLQKRHIEEYLSSRNELFDIPEETINEAATVDTEIKKQALPPEQFPANIEVYEMNRMRKIIADNLTISSKTVPHVTSFVEADVTNLVTWREKVKNEFAQTYKVKLTLTPIIIEAIAAGIKKFPEVNVSLSGNNILMKKDINIGMATILPDRNLIVPVIKNADQLSLNGLAQAVSNLSDRARKNELLSNEITGGTFTFTNIGVFGTLTGAPLVNLPESAILSIGAIVKKPMAILVNGNYTIGIRDSVMLSLSYDHRIIDGGLGGYFLKSVSEYFI